MEKIDFFGLGVFSFAVLCGLAIRIGAYKGEGKACKCIRSPACKCAPAPACPAGCNP